jgi:hypothetical protein
MISPCPSNPNGVCITRIVTSANVTLPANANGYTIYYSSSARSSGIQNILNSNSSGFAYYANIPSSISFPGNRTPIFNNLPSPSICIGIPLQLDMSASDPDGDSLAYSFISPLSSISGSGPLTFTPINFAGNSTQTDPTGSGLTINPVTGIVSGVQNNIGLYSIAVLVQEFRNGIQIGQMMRDFVYNFQACPITQIPLFDINGNINQCDSTVSIVLDAQQIANNLNNFVWNSGRVGR